MLFYIYGGYGEVVNTSACEVDIRRCESDWPPFEHADVAELADALGLGPSVLKDVRVRLSPSAFRRSFADVFTQSPIDTSVSLAANGHFIIVL